jgi:hypothetical protein
MNRGCRQMLQNQGNQLPARAVLRPDGLYLALRDIGAAELRDAFMQETIVRVPAVESFVHIARADVGKAAPDTAPSGLIFHVARCGSTLISQLLKTHDNLVVYAEPLPFNELLLPPHAWPRHELIAALRSLGDAFARHARKPYVLKFSSWNTLFCDVLAEAFPRSPWVLSLRDPVEVGVSLLRQPPGWMRATDASSSALGRYVDPDGAAQAPEEFVARLYGAFCTAVGRLDAGRGRLVYYETLPAAVWEIVAPHFSQAVDERQRERMAQAARSNSKAPVGKVAEFASDAATKQAAATATLRQAIESFALPSLQRLESLHLQRGRVGSSQRPV